MVTVITYAESISISINLTLKSIFLKYALPLIFLFTNFAKRLTLENWLQKTGGGEHARGAP